MVLSFLEDRALRLLFFGGKGGVGKTTCAAAAALARSSLFPRDAFLLVSTDPAHSLADSLADFQPPQNLRILEFNAQECLEAFQVRHRDHLREIASRGTFLDDQDISQFLDLSLPGLDELMALLEIARWVETRSYDGIIVDTAPTGHTLRLLLMPDLIRHWLGALDTLLAKHRFLRKRFKGVYEPDELDGFLSDLAASVRRLEDLMQDPGRCRFVPVTLAEEVVLQETGALLKQLARLKIPVREIVVNRLFPESACPVCQDGRRRQGRLLERLGADDQWRGKVFWGLPLYAAEVRGANLEAFWKGAMGISLAGPAPRAIPLDLPPRVEGPPVCPAPSTTMLIFAGKGGVGKSTLACATAVRLAQETPGREILLCSTDPAHSLTACLGLPVGPQPVRVLPGLTAMEIDAAAEFQALKQQYRLELQKAISAFFAQWDLPFDRRVLERLLDLSPPGLDEIMALNRALEFLEDGSFALLILDAAPTGHLLRFLELPDLIDQWLKSFFGVLLKYHLTFRLPDLAQRLVRLSKDLKRLRTWWQDPSRAAVYAVAILTEMAFQETADLLAACGRLGVAAPVLFLNQATPASAHCTLCTAIHRREELMVGRFRQEFPGRHLTVVYRQQEPRGIARLKELGQALYRPLARENRNGIILDLPAVSG